MSKMLDITNFDNTMYQTIAIFQKNSISRNGYRFNGIAKGISRFIMENNIKKH